jgi:hypothetical protein
VGHAAEIPAAKRMFQVPRVHPGHERQIRCLKLVGADRRQENETAPGFGMAEQLAVRGFGRASSSAQQSRLGERPFYTIILQRPLPDLGGQDPQVRFLCLGMPCTDKHIGLESRYVIPSRPSHALAPLFAMFSTTWVEQDYPLSHCLNLRGHF